MIKRFQFLITAIVVCNIANAQFYKSLLTPPEFNSALEKIVLDFRFNYNTIKGDSILKEGSVETYASSVILPGAANCVISYFNSKLDTTANWQGIMYSGDNFKQAAKTYENVFKMIKHSHIKWIDRSSIGFSGDMQAVKEEVRFAASTLSFDLDDPRYKKFEAEVEMAPANEGWEVRLNLYSKKPDTEGPDVKG